MPGFPEPATAIEKLRRQVRAAAEDKVPERQSQWFHISLGRVLEPVEAERLKPAIETIEAWWGEKLMTQTISELLWTHEKQWYMVQKRVLHRLALQTAAS